MFVGVYIVAAKRTPFGTFGGKLKDITATDLATVASTAALKSGNVKPEQVDTAICGNVAAVSFFYHFYACSRTPLYILVF